MGNEGQMSVTVSGIIFDNEIDLERMKPISNQEFDKYLADFQEKLAKSNKT